MTRTAVTGLAVIAVLAPAWAQQADRALDDQQMLGRRLFVQSCGVCHTNVQRTSALYGPVLSRNSLNGNDEVLRDVISNGTPRMPGFRHHFERGEIDAIVAWLKTVPPAPPTGQRR